MRHETILWKRFEAYITGVGKDRAEVDWRRCVALQTMQLSTRIMAPTMQRWDRRHQQREAVRQEEMVRNVRLPSADGRLVSARVREPAE